MEVSKVKKVGVVISYFAFLLVAAVYPTDRHFDVALNSDMLYTIPLSIFFVVVGVPCLLSFYQRSAYSALGFSLFIVALAFFFRSVILIYEDDEVSIDQVIYIGLRSAFECLIWFGVLAGRVSVTQIVFLVILFVGFFAYIDYLRMHRFAAKDYGGAATTHMKAGLFGFGVNVGLRLVNRKKERLELPCGNKKTSYGGYAIAFIGALVMYALFPVFNTADSTEFNGNFLISNFVAQFGATFMVFVMTGILNHWFLDPFNIIHQSLAGSVAIAGSSQVMPQIAMCAFVGAIAGFIAVLSSRFLTPLLTRKFGLHDTRDVLSVHTIPGLIGGLVAGIVASHNHNISWAEDTFWIVLLYIPFSFIWGFICGCVLARFDRLTRDEHYDDGAMWGMPSEMRKVIRHKVRMKLNYDANASDESSDDRSANIVSSESDLSVSSGQVVYSEMSASAESAH